MIEDKKSNWLDKAMGRCRVEHKAMAEWEVKAEMRRQGVLGVPRSEIRRARRRVDRLVVKGGVLLFLLYVRSVWRRCVSR